jgi:hypothetical protein
MAAAWPLAARAQKAPPVYAYSRDSREAFQGVARPLKTR